MFLTFVHNGQRARLTEVAEIVTIVRQLGFLGFLGVQNGLTGRTLGRSVAKARLLYKKNWSTSVTGSPMLAPCTKKNGRKGIAEARHGVKKRTPGGKDSDGRGENGNGGRVDDATPAG